MEVCQNQLRVHRSLIFFIQKYPLKKNIFLYLLK